jgi:hypothetical protein
MADDYVIEAAKELARQRKQRARSFFPAADAINSTPQGQVIMPQGGSQNFHALPPDQNPAYQAAIVKGRPDTSSYVWLKSPDGVGQMRVPVGSVTALNQAIPGSYVEPTGPLTQQQYASNYARGYGAPNPSFNPETGTLSSKGVETPVEALTIPQRSQIPGSNPFLEQWAANFSARNPRLGALGNLAVKTFSGVRGAFNAPAASQYVNNVSTGQLPPVPTFRQQASQSQNFFNYNPSPVPPRRYSDLGYY